MYASITALFALAAFATAGPMPVTNGESSVQQEAIPMKLNLSEIQEVSQISARTPLAKRDFCQYKVWSYGTGGCSGNDYQYEGVFSSTSCIALKDSSYRTSLYVEPQGESRCHSGNSIEMYKSNSIDYCAGGVKYTIQFGDTTCISPSGTHPFDSAILNL